MISYECQGCPNCSYYGDYNNESEWVESFDGSFIPFGYYWFREETPEEKREREIQESLRRLEMLEREAHKQYEEWRIHDNVGGKDLHFMEMCYVVDNGCSDPNCNCFVKP